MIESIPFIFEPIQMKDFALGFLVALALRRGRVDAVMNKIPIFSNGNEES